jgi:hypothetical protein
VPKTEGLGFSFEVNKQGEVQIYRNGILATSLRANAANKFLSFSEQSSFRDIQLKMAKLTGNYRRGNERMAKSKHRND